MEQARHQRGDIGRAGDRQTDGLARRLEQGCHRVRAGIGSQSFQQRRVRRRRPALEERGARREGRGTGQDADIDAGGRRQAAAGFTVAGAEGGDSSLPLTPSSLASPVSSSPLSLHLPQAAVRGGVNQRERVVAEAGQNFGGNEQAVRVGPWRHRQARGKRRRRKTEGPGPFIGRPRSFPLFCPAPFIAACQNGPRDTVISARQRMEIETCRLAARVEDRILRRSPRQSSRTSDGPTPGLRATT